MSFRHRLALFLIATLVVVQGLTAVFAYAYLRSSIVEKAKVELAASARVFIRELSLLSEGAADDVKVLSLDYALRQAIAQHDYETEISALRNHGMRVKAARMMLVGLDGAIAADTGSQGATGNAFAHPDLLNDAAQSDESTALVTLGDRVYWIVVTPVRAPVPIAFIAAFIPVDSGLLDKLAQIASTPRSLALATMASPGHWKIAARTANGPATIPVAGLARSAFDTAMLSSEHGKEYLTVATRLEFSAVERTDRCDPRLSAERRAGAVLVDDLADAGHDGRSPSGRARGRHDHCALGVATAGKPRGHGAPDRSRRLHAAAAPRPGRRDRPVVRGARADGTLHRRS